VAYKKVYISGCGASVSLMARKQGYWGKKKQLPYRLFSAGKCMLTKKQ